MDLFSDSLEGKYNFLKFTNQLRWFSCPDKNIDLKVENYKRTL